VRAADKRNSSIPKSQYPAIRSATSSWLPTSAVPASPRTRPMPAHMFGETSRASVRPPCSAAIRRWPSAPDARWTCAQASAAAAARGFAALPYLVQQQPPPGGIPWYVAAIWAARVAETSPGRSAAGT
jgi:hypothetical protein